MIEPLLICTDLDRTLLPNGNAPESLSARGRFAGVVSHREVALAYVTGRHQALVKAAIEEYSLPLPQFVIGDVGTSIYELDGESWRTKAAWRSRLASEWPAETPARLVRLLNAISGLRLQEDSKQGDFKLSFYTPPDDEPGPWLQEVERRLGEEGLEVRVIFSRDEVLRLGLLDVVPRQAGKLPAIEFLVQQLGIQRSRTMFAGDSGNDMEVLTSDLPAVLVRNAAEAIRCQARDEAAARGHSEMLYLARGDFLGMNGNYSAGILEGLVHYLPEVEAWMR